MISEKKLEIVFVIFLLILGFYYIYLASGTPMLGEDEANYYSLSKDLSKGNLPIYTIANLPASFIYFTSMLSSFYFLMTGPSLAILKVISAFFGLLTLFLIYL